MIDILFFAAALAAFFIGLGAAIRALTDTNTWPGPWLHTCPTSELLEVVADRTRDKALAAALRDRAAQFAAHND